MRTALYIYIAHKPAQKPTGLKKNARPKARPPKIPPAPHKSTCVLLNIYTIICLKSVAVRKRQVAILVDRLGRCLKLTVSSESISCHEFASQFGLEFFFIREKKHQTIVARMLFTSIRYAARYTTKLGAAELSQLGAVPVRRLAIHYDVGGCGVQVYEFKPHAGSNGFFPSLLLFAINKAYS